MQREACHILGQIVSWLLESDASDTKCRQNHKGVFGRIGIVGGGRDNAGAPYFASMSAMKLGADRCYVICTRSASQTLKSYSPDLIVMPLLDCPCEAEFETEMDCLLSKLHAIVVGPGLGGEELLQARAKKIIEWAKVRSLPIVLDGETLLLVNRDPSIVQSYPKVLLTPNMMELQKMLDSYYATKTFDLENMQTNDVETLVRQYSLDLNVTVLAKGITDIICDGSGLKLLSDKTSGSNRRCAGQGSILCGLAGVYCHWIQQANETSGNKINNLMVWAAYLAATTTRRCNELAYGEFHRSTLASNMVDKINGALKSLLKSSSINSVNDHNDNKSVIKNAEYVGVLSRDEIGRYTRQMIMEDFGPSRQASLKKTSVLIIGAGGLGCPVAIYLGASGIGCLGIVDDDTVELSNLNRQILHNMDKIGMLKTESTKQAVVAINPNVHVKCHSIKFTRHNAVDLVENYDIIIDCTGNLLTRYVISDACVYANKPLVSGTALKMDGQMTVYNYDRDTPCFRCLFPEPPAPNTVGNCSDSGIISVLPGIIGVQQALEAIKIGTGLRPAYAGKMLLFDGQLGLFRHITLGKRKSNCEACGIGSKQDRDLIDYDEFFQQTQSETKQTNSNAVSEPDEQVTVEQYKDILQSGKPHVLIDVRPKDHSDISRFKHAIQIPMKWLQEDQKGSLEQIKNALKSKDTNEVFVVCRRGNASQRGKRIIRDLLKDEMVGVTVKDITGGMTAWSKFGDPDNYLCV